MTEIINPKIVDQVFSEQITYTEAVFNHPSPLMVKITPIGGTTAPTLSINAVGSLSELQVPSKVINLSQSYLSFDLSFAVSDANQATIINGNLGSIIDRVTLSTVGSNTILCDISNVSEYLEATDVYQTYYTDYIKNPTQPAVVTTQTAVPGTAGDPATIGAVNTSVLATVNSTKVSPTVTATEATAQLTPYMDIGKVNAYTNPIGATYLGNTSGDDNGAIVTGPRNVYIGGIQAITKISVKLPLSMFHSTIMGINKNIYFSGETLNLAIYWAAAQSYAWSATIGSGLPDLSTTVGPPKQPTMSNLALYACVEQNAFLTSKIVNQINTEGLTFPCPVVWSSKQTITSDQQPITINITKSSGNSLLWVCWSPFKNPEAATRNLCKAHTTYQLQQYQTMLNQIPILSNTPVNVLTGESFMYNLPNIEGSCIQSLIGFNNHFVHWDNFTGMSLPKLNEHLTWANGLDLSREMQQYQLNATWTGTPTINNYIFWCAQKQLVLTRNGVMLI